MNSRWVYSYLQIANLPSSVASFFGCRAQIAARNVPATIVQHLTEKDAVKCASFANQKFWVLRVDAQLDPALIELLLRKLSAHGCKTA